ncbi:uncharacterized protein LOC135923445 isoform X1 [Gordionus sp. m RMFG-2023]|uniref:uncharacterized protein LOC135923445 isoform X1 n=1 Tax=Gordionus sp. m RMFG-2023 TaxID=3053472 RepID=UPI0031FC4F18
MSQIIKCLLEKAGISYEVECGTDWNINTSYYNDLILSPALQCDKLINVLLECISDINDFFENNSCETDFWYIEDSDILNKGLNFLAMMINRIRLKKQLIQKNDLNQNITIQDLIINILASTLYIKLVLLKGSLVYNIFQISLINKIIDNIYYICKNGHLVQGNENRLENTFILKYKDKSKSQRTTRSRKFSYDFLEKIDDNLFTDKRLPSKSLNNIQHFWISCNDPETKHILLNSLCQFLSSWNFFYTKNDNKVQNLIDSTDYFENGNKMNMTTFREESTLEIRILHLMAIRKFVYGNVETLVSKTNEQAKIYVSKIDDLIFEVFYNYCLNPLVFTTNDDSTSQNHLIDSLERRFRHLFDLLEEDMVKNDKNTSCLFFTKLYIERILLYLSHLKEIIPSYSEPGASVLDRIFQKQLYILSQNLTLNRLENCNNCVSQLFAQSMSIKAKIKYVIWMARLSKAVDADLVSASADMVNCFIRNGCLLNANSESGSLLNESNLNDPLVYCLKPAYLLRIIMMGSMHEKSASVRGKFLSCLLKYFERYLNHAASLKELLEPCLDKSESKSKETLKEPIFCASEEYLEINQSVLDDCIHTNEPLSITEMLIREYTSQNPVTKNNAEESVVPTGDSAMDEISPHINERENFENELRSKFASFSELCTLSSLISYPTNKETESILTNGITFRHILALLNIRMTQEPTAHVRRMAIEITGKLVSFSMLNLSDKTFRGQISHLTEHNNDVNQDNAHESMTSDDYDRTKIYVPEILKLLDFYQIIPVLLEASLHDKTMMVRKQAICSLTAIITQIMPHIDSESSSNMAPLLLDWIKTLLICFFDQNLSSKGSGLNEKCLDIAERHILGPIFFDRGEKEVNDLAWKIIDSLINNIICFIPFTFAKTHDSYDSDKANVINKIDVCHKNALYFTVPSNSPWRNMFQSLFAAFTLKFKDANSINTRLLKKSHLTANLSYYKERLFLMHIICRLQPHSYIQIIKDSLKTSGNLDDIVHSLKLITDQYIGKELVTLLRYHKIKTNLSSPFLEKKDDRIGETLSGNNESYLIDALGLIKYYLVCLTTFVISLKDTTDKTNLVIWIFGLVTTVSQQLGQMLGGYGWQNVSLCTALIEVIKSINSLFPGIFATLFKKRDDRRESNSELSNQHSISYYDESIQLPYRTMSELVIACRKRLEQFLTGNGEGGEKISEEDGPISEEQSVIKSLVMLGEIIILYPEFLDKTLCYIVLSLVISNDDKNNGSIFDRGIGC